MKRSGMKHPPKKKHTNKVRKPPVEPLSEDERSALAQQEFDKSVLHLEEAESLSGWGKTPNACAHSAYYAMHHCAAAAILAAGGVGKRKDVPKSHEHVIEHFGKLTESEPGFLGDAGRALSRARTDRDVADYQLERSVSSADAAATTIEARKFVDACAAKWGFTKST
ncbi:MAG: hypothetical protein KDJ88_13905 [Bauldia sp.]|nr:hypothetical protein [Bauldia sp.]